MRIEQDGFAALGLCPLVHYHPKAQLPKFPGFLPNSFRSETQRVLSPSVTLIPDCKSLGLLRCYLRLLVVLDSVVRSGVETARKDVFTSMAHGTSGIN